MFSFPNNGLQFFPTTRGAAATQQKLQRILQVTTSRPPTEIQRNLAYQLYDDDIEYMTTLEMNRAASYTFGFQSSYGLKGTAFNNAGTGGTHGDSIVSQLWEILLTATLCQCTQHSVLALTKTLHLLRHVIVHGSEAACVADGETLLRIEGVVEPLRRLNTALVEQQALDRILGASGGDAAGVSSGGLGGEYDAFGGLTAMSNKAAAAMLKLRGGSVDKGHPVRVAACELFDLLSGNNGQNLRRLRAQQASTSSLVPVGDANKVGFITDEGRFRLLQEKMEREESQQKQQQQIEARKLMVTRSNLAKSSDGFGGGFSTASTNHGGKAVVGAAHSLDEMIKSAKYELESSKQRRMKAIASMKKGYSDDPEARARELEELERHGWETDPKVMEKEKALKEALEYLEEMRRLEGGEEPNHNTEDGKAGTANDGSTGTTDLLGLDSDIFAGSSNTSSISHSSNGGGAVMDLLDFGTTMNATSTAIGTTAGAKSENSFGGGMDIFSPYGNTTTNVNVTNSTNQGMNHHNPMGIESIEMRPSLVTGTRDGVTSAKIGVPTGAGGGSTHAYSSGGDLLDLGQSEESPGLSGTNSMPKTAMGGYSLDNTDNAFNPMGASVHVSQSPTEIPPPQDPEEAEEKERKMKMAAGLFAGVLPSAATNSTTAYKTQTKSIMGTNRTNAISAFDELIPVSDTPLTSGTSLGMEQSSNVSTTDPPHPPSMNPPPPPAMDPPPPPSVDPPPPPSVDPPPPPSMDPPPPPEAGVGVAAITSLPKDNLNAEPNYDSFGTNIPMGMGMGNVGNLESVNAMDNRSKSMGTNYASNDVGQGNAVNVGGNPMGGLENMPTISVSNPMGNPVSNPINNNSSNTAMPSFNTMSPDQMRQMMIQQQAQMQQMMQMMMAMGIQQPQQQGSNFGMMGGMQGNISTQPMQQQNQFMQGQQQYPGGNNINGSGWPPASSG